MHNKSKKELDAALLLVLKKEMAQPRMAKSAKTTQANLNIARLSKQPSITVPGTVDKVIPSRRPSQPEKAQIAVGKADSLRRDLRIENKLTDEHGHDVRLKKGAHVEVTVAAKTQPGQLTKQAT